MSSKTTNRKNGTRKVGKSFPSASLTEQSHGPKCNINAIMARARRTQTVPVYHRQATFGDFTGVEDYQTALNKVIEAERDFMKLPAEIRKEFNNDPAKLIEFMSDDKNYKRAQEIGLIEKPVDPPPTRVEVVNASGENAPE
jgi:phage internal scaffolding protein